MYRKKKSVKIPKSVRGHFLVHSSGGSSWLTAVREIKTELRRRTCESIWGRVDIILTPLLRQRRPHCTKEKTRWAVPSFFTSGSKRLIPPPFSTAHLDLTAINIWCSNCTLKHDSPTGPVAQYRAESFYSIPKMYFMSIICNHPACIFVKKC